MKALILTNEYPPYIYGGAGVHVEYLSRELAKLCSVEVRCFGDQKQHLEALSVKGFPYQDHHYSSPKPLQRVFDALQRCLDFNGTDIDADIVHVHTWYTHFGGILGKLCYGVPLIVTVHSLEPFRPWKREQLAGGYDFSCWVERMAIEMADAVIAVSSETKKDITRLFHVNKNKVHVVYNGIDLQEYRYQPNPVRLRQLGIDPEKPFVFFCGRITRQKGILHFLNAVRYMDRGYQIVICANAPDTPEIGEETGRKIAAIQAERPGVVWLQNVRDVETKVVLYSHADVFCCPSIYEPFGIINLEAMACETPVVASAVGGITEVVVHGETGFLVPFVTGANDTLEPVDADKFEQELAVKINMLMDNEPLRLRMGKASRRRVEEVFSWSSIAKQTHQLYDRTARREFQEIEDPSIEPAPFPSSVYLPATKPQASQVG